MTEEQKLVLAIQATHEFNKYRDIVGFCESCSRPMRNKTFSADLWQGDPKAVTAANSRMCAACATRGGKPPTQPHKRTRASENRPEKPLETQEQINRSGGFQMPLLASITVSRAESAAVIASAHARLGMEGAVSIAEILGIRQ